MAVAVTDDRNQLRQERDLYRSLLELGAETQVPEFLRSALALIVEISGAQHGYIEIRGSDDEPIEWTASGLSENGVADAKSIVSRGIVARAMSRGDPISTAAAHRDPRFDTLASVQEASIGAVLCVPIGEGQPLGVVYLEGRETNAAFSDDDCERVALVARHLTPFVARHLAVLSPTHRFDPTADARAKLAARSVVGRSQALADVLSEAALVAPLDVSILITGDSGTGKTQLAHIIHDSSPRRGALCLEMNCAALPADLVENEMFGSDRGAHSTAHEASKGKIAEAEHGTLFLDEVGELPLVSQAKLLQFLHSKQYFPLGSSSPHSADVRVIAATNADLESAIEKGTFREDLYYRLCVIPIRIPSLAERREDIPLLADALCAQACRSHGLAALTLSPNVQNALVVAEWPGNVRQLSHAIEAAAIRANGDKAAAIETRHMFPGRRAGPEHPTLQQAMREFQGTLVRQTLDKCSWNVSEAARQLDVARSYLYKLIQAHSLARGPDD